MTNSTNNANVARDNLFGNETNLLVILNGWA